MRLPVFSYAGLPLVTVMGRPWAPIQGARLPANDHHPRRLLVAVHYYAVGRI